MLFLAPQVFVKGQAAFVGVARFAEIGRKRAEIVERDGDKVTVRFNWNTLSFRYKTNYSYFGMSCYVIDFSTEQPKILSKYVVLKNDYINQVIDIYHL